MTGYLMGSADRIAPNMRKKQKFFLTVYSNDDILI